MSGRDTKESRDYTPQDVVNQSLVAFGQGTQFMRVSSRACRVLVEIVSYLAEAHDVTTTWDRDAVQALERLRVAGRLAAQRAIEEGRTYVDAEDVKIAMRRVRAVSKSTWCDDGDGGSKGGDGGDAQPADLP